MPLSGLKKVFFVLFGILISFLIIEIFLQIGAFLFQRQANKGEVTKNLNRVDSSSFNIICVGDSYTFGAGAKNGYSYPEQLQKLINEENLKWTVYNLGTGGMNSSTLLLKLPKWIELYSPRIVVLLIGANDYWNLENSNYYLFQKGKRAYIYRLEEFLFQFRTYKLLKLLAMSMNKLIYGQKKNHINFTPIRKPNLEIENELRLARKYLGQERDFNKVKELAQNVIITDPQNDEAYFLLGSLYYDTNEFKLSEENFKKALEINPYNLEAHKQLFRLYWSLNANEPAEKELEVMLRISPEDEDLKKLQKFGIPPHKDEELCFKQLTYNLIQVLKLAKPMKIYLILQNYPNSYPPYAQEAIRYISQKYGLSLVDNASAFSGLNYKDYSASDAHPNERGYSVIAKNVFKELKKINDKTSP